MTDEPTGGAAGSATVLVVEDETALADLYARWLADAYTVETAYDGEAALDRIDDGVDVVVLDRRMPGPSGDETLEAIRDRGYDCRVAMVTAVEPAFDVVEMGFDEYLVKPVRGDELRETVERLVRRAAYDREVREYFALVSKRSALEAEKTDAALASSPQYAALQDDIADLDERLDDTFTEVEESTAFGALLRDDAEPESPD